MELLAPGDLIDRYELLCPIAHGGMGSIWAARLRSMSQFERLFAIKVMLPEFAADAAFRTMMLDEGRIAAGILHPNVGQVLDVGQHATGIYLVMEWIDGDTLLRVHLAAAKRSTRVPLPVVMRVVADVCAGLHAAHEVRDRAGQLLDVVHRDVSPNNIIVTSSGSVKLIDFGIAKARGRAQEETTNGEVKGKLRYMSPEQAQGRPVDRRADIWSLGAVLHLLLTGDPPYSRGSEAAALYDLVQGKPLKPLPATVPGAIRTIVARALQHDPAERFQTALAMKEALETAGDELGVRATTASVEAYYGSMMQGHVEARREALEQAAEAVSRRGLEREPITHSRVRAPSNSSVTLRVVPPVAPPASHEHLLTPVPEAPVIVALLPVPTPPTPAFPEPPEVALTSTAAPWVSPPTTFGRATPGLEDTASGLRQRQWRGARWWVTLASAVTIVGAAWAIAPSSSAPAPAAVPVVTMPPDVPEPATTGALAPAAAPVPPPAAEAPAPPAPVPTTVASDPTPTTRPVVQPRRPQRAPVVVRRAAGPAPELTSIDSRK